LPKPPYPSQAPGWGWAALILPFIEQDPLHRLIDFQLPVEAVTSQQARETVVRLYTCPTDRMTGLFDIKNDGNVVLASATTNSYAGCYGAEGLVGTQPDLGNGVLSRNSQVRMADVRDGLSNTLAVGERGAFFTQTPWAGVITSGTARTTPGAPVYTSIAEPAPTMVLARIGRKVLNDPYCEPYDFFSPHTGAVQFLVADGSAQPLRTTVSVPVLQGLATRAGDEPLGAGDY